MWTHAPPKTACSQSGAVETGMSPGLDMKPVEYQWASRQTLGQTYMLSSSMLPLSVSSGPQDFRLPSLSTSTHSRTTTVPLSISEPSLFRPRHWAFLGDVSSKCPPLHRRAPSLPSCKSTENSKMPQQSHHQVYMHFSQPLRPVPKVGKRSVARGGQKQATDRRSLQPLVRQNRQPVDHETLSVRGKTYLPSQPLPTAASRKELHIFLPAQGTGEDDIRDSESVDEGFMDELENKISTLTDQHDVKIPKQSYVTKSLLGDVLGQVAF